MVDITTQGAAQVTTQSVCDEEDELEFISEPNSGERVKQVVLASVLASLSIAIAPVAEIVPRVPGWGIAIFDPVSIFWVISFLLGGIWVGLVSTVAGTMGLFLYDPTAIGPVFKLIATLPMILVPWFGVRKINREVGGETLSRPKLYGTFMVLAFLLRLGLMVPLNLAYGAIAYPFFTIDFIINYAIILNAIASIWDALIPFIIVHPTGVFKAFRLW